jgi:hypothetical protein
MMGNYVEGRVLFVWEEVCFVGWWWPTRTCEDRCSWGKSVAAGGCGVCARRAWGSSLHGNAARLVATLKLLHSLRRARITIFYLDDATRVRQVCG